MWVLVTALLLVAGGEFIVRGPLRFAEAANFSDFISPYTQTRAWLQGIDPYSPASLVELWPAEKFDFLGSDLASGTLVLKRGIPTAYPPTCFVLLAPLAVIPWRIAHFLWLAISLAACGVTVFSLLSLLGLHWSEQRTFLFLALALALAPFHTGMAAGSLVIVVVGVCALSLWAANRQFDVGAGILMAVAIGLKPQIGLPFLAYYLLRRRWPVFGTTVVLVAILAALAILHLTVTHTPWIDSYRYDNRILFAHGSLGDFTEANPIRFGLINLQVLLYVFLSDRTTANVLAFIVVAVLGLFWLFLIRRRHGSELCLLDLSAMVVLSLLPVYHRLYDASLLIFPLAWSLTALGSPLKQWAKATLLLVLVFLVPGGSLLERLQHTNHFVALQHSWWWTHFAMPHQIWALVLLSGVLLQAMRRTSGGARIPLRDPVLGR